MDLSAVIAVLLFKLASISAGVFFAWMGYRLFMSGIWGNAGELEANYKNTKLVLTGAAPGTFFTVLGAVIVVCSVYTGFEIRKNPITETSQNIFDNAKLPIRQLDEQPLQ